MKLKVVLEPSAEGGYTVYVPSLPGALAKATMSTRHLPISGKPLICILKPQKMIGLRNLVHWSRS